MPPLVECVCVMEPPGKLLVWPLYVTPVVWAILIVMLNAVITAELVKLSCSWPP